MNARDIGINQSALPPQKPSKLAEGLERILGLGFNSVDELIDQLERSFITFSNPLLATDVYKMGHMEQIKKGTTKIVAYIYARSDRQYKHIVPAGLYHLLNTYLARRITKKMCEEFLENKAAICALATATESTIAESKRKIMSLAELGYIPLEIRAIPEGTVMKAKNMIATVTNTHDDFAWCVGFFESLLLKMWEMMTTASCMFAYRRVVDYYFNKTVSPEQDWLREYMVHDFGYRSAGTEEGAQTTGLAQAIFSKGSDTVPAREYAIRMYGANRKGEIMYSPPASEHAVACSYGTDEAGEIEYLNSMLDIYVKGLVSLVSDTINVYVMVTERAMVVKDRILNREGKTVFRPDSGDPEKVICGDPDAPVGSREWKGVLRLLDEGFGHTVNDKGFRVLNQKIGLIYGDGMFLMRYARVMQRMMEMGYAASNLVIGVGGILRMHTRDTLGVTLKDVYMVINGVPTNIRKDPVTDKGKRSHCGLPAVVLNADGHHETIDGCTDEQFASSLTQLVFLDGAVHNAPVLDDMRARGAAGLQKYPLTEDDLAELLS